MTSPYVLLIEDNDTKGSQLEAALRLALGAKTKVERLKLAGTPKPNVAYEDQLAAVLEGPAYNKLALIVTDRDLSTAGKYPGLSEAVVSKVAARLFIPACVYASGKPDSFLERLKIGGDGRIILDATDPEVLGRKVGVLADGFLQLRTRVEAILSSKDEARKYHGPASVLAELLNAREVTEHLTLYARGDQRMISELMPVRPHKAKVRAPKGSDAKRISLALGVWLYDSVLRFPGLLVGEIAGASFLDIDPAQFAGDDVKKVFRKALYDGPFADPAEPRWWRHRLLELIANGKATNGRELAQNVLKKRLRPCKCSVNGRAPSGYYCVITEEPVCEEHSVAQVSWLPRGADLARVKLRVYEEIGPWIGLS
jgi:hypothetical protein